MIVEWLARWLARHRPREGWFLVFLPLSAVSILAPAADAAGWVPGLGELLGLSMALAYLMAFWSSRTTLTGRQAALLLSLAGALGVSLLVGWPEAPQAPAQTPWYAVPAVRAGLALDEVALRLVQWAGEVRAGGAAQDDLVFRWLLGTAGWGVAAWAAWWVFSRQDALLGLLPAGVLLAANLYFTLEGRFWLPVFLGCLAALLVLVQRWSLEQRWRRRSMDYSEELQLENAMTALVVALVVFAATSPMPRLVIGPTARWFARLTAEPVAAVEEAGQRLFPGLRRQPRSLLATGGGPGGMPRAFLLGSGPELSQDLVLRVAVAGQPAPGDSAQLTDQLYWRAFTLDTYNGRGWENGPSTVQRYGAGERWTEAQPRLHRPLRQRVEVLRGGDVALFAAGEPLAPDRAYEAQVRAGPGAAADDLVALLISSRRYEVLSLVPAASAADLRSAGQEYPTDLAGRYLGLADVPRRVLDLARRVTWDVDNPYDRALALEHFLRDYRYDLQVNPAPPSRDVVDYFLFDVQAGYCDYFASAMIVMARSLGIPARLAVGYATGQLDPASGLYLVAEDNAHSWPELYFPGAGWIPFEPTAARSLFARSGPAGTQGEPEADAQVAAELQTLREDDIVRRRLRRLLGLVAASLAVVIGWWAWRRRPLPALVDLYGQLGRWGVRLGRPPGLGDTAGDFGRAFGVALLGRDGEQSDLAARGVGRFVEGFEGAVYSQRREEPAGEARQVWGWLNPLLWRLWLKRLLGIGGRE